MDKILVTKPHLPPLDAVMPLLEEIWGSAQLTNGGKYHQRLEAALQEFLVAPHVSLFCNGTIALISALQSQNLSGEVITTPYTFPATAHALRWNNLLPRFVDVDPTTLNICPDAIESAITEETSAILAVHVYGVPCDVERIQKIADAYRLKVIYDAAHAFGADCHCGQLLSHGDVSILSFHATKVFNTLEGGAVISNSREGKDRIDRLKNFGIETESKVFDAGLNGKMSEVNAAIGLVQLEYIKSAIAQRKQVYDAYISELQGIDGIRLPVFHRGLTKHNFAYFPVIVEDHFPMSRDDLLAELENKGIFARRYFYPLVSELEVYKNLLGSQVEITPNARFAAERILCLPIYPGLVQSDIERVIEAIQLAGK